MTAIWMEPLKFILIGIDLLITIVTFGWIKALQKLFEPPPLRSVPVNNDPAHRVQPRFKKQLAITPVDGCYTLYDLVSKSFRAYGTHNCMGDRTLLGWKVPKKVKHFADGINWISFADVGNKVHQFGAALRGVGVVPAPDITTLEQVTTSCRIAIFENTCKEWMIAAIGAVTQSITVTTVYATLGMDAVVEAVQENLIKVLVCNKKDVAKILTKCSTMSSLTHIVYTIDGIAPDETVTLPTTLPPGVTVIEFQEFLESGNTTAYPPTPPKPTTAAVIMYTSGSTGKPKGVVITHAEIVATCASVDVAFKIIPGMDCYLGYLPLAHILEMAAEFTMFSLGCPVCYADPKTLTSSGAYPKGAFDVYSPTLMVAVPKIWDIIKKGVQAKITKSPPIVRFLISTAFEWKKFAKKNGFDTPLFNILVFRKFKQGVGGRLRFGLSGGGPLNQEVQDFIRCAFSIDICQGYGLTETCAAVAVQDLSDLRGGVVGAPLASVEVKLVSTPDISDINGNPYLSTDTKDADGNPIFGRGEITVRGNNISLGYYMMPDVTKEVYGDDGWFQTGDIGQFLSDGSIRIIDRKKNLVKLKGGEYIALEKMEMVYNNSIFVDAVHGGICCYGDGDMDRCVAIMQLNEKHTMEWATEHGVTGDFNTVKNSKELNDAILAEMGELHSKSDLSHLEKLVGVTVLTEPWTPENGCLTAANKLQRRTVITKFSKEFEAVKPKGIF